MVGSLALIFLPPFSPQTGFPSQVSSVCLSPCPQHPTFFLQLSAPFTLSVPFLQLPAIAGEEIFAPVIEFISGISPPHFLMAAQQCHYSSPGASWYKFLLSSRTSGSAPNCTHTHSQDVVLLCSTALPHFHFTFISPIQNLSTSLLPKSSFIYIPKGEHHLSTASSASVFGCLPCLLASDSVHCFLLFSMSFQPFIHSITKQSSHPVLRHPWHQNE